MKDILVAVFPDEGSARAGSLALTGLGDRGGITLHSSTVLVKTQAGTSQVRTGSDHGPVGTLVGMVGGGLIGGVGGPVGAIAGAFVGTVGGLFYDVFRGGLDIEVVDEAAAALEPGNGALIADLEQGSVLDVDGFLAAHGGRVLKVRP